MRSTTKISKISISQDNNGYTIKVVLPSGVVSTVYHHTLVAHQRFFKAQGFSQGSVPLSYLKKNFQPFLISHLKEFLCQHCVVAHLYEGITSQCVIAAHDPRLEAISITEDKGATFTFKLPRFQLPSQANWRSHSFKSPSRKNYKDLDRQAEFFLQTEFENKQKATQDTINPGDWILFSVSLSNGTSCLLGSHHEHLWLKIGKEETDKDAHELFLSKSINTIFNTKNHLLQQYFSKQLDTNYTYNVSITDHIPTQYFCIDFFKHHFKISTLPELHKKFIEVFSHRNDISQRREIVEATFKVLHKYYPVTLPKWLVDEQKQQVLQIVRHNPDYFVYKAQKNFDQQIQMLAEKQLREKIVIDHLMREEKIEIQPKDIPAYLSFYQRPRMKEFIYFRIPPTQYNGQEQPLSQGIIKQACLREKTLNHIIRVLTDKN